MTRQHHYGPIRFIPGTNNGKYPYCHSIFIEEAGVLIDPSSDRETLKKLKQENDVKMIWLSHWHEDHFQHIDLFDDLPLWTHKLDATPLSDIEIYMDWSGVDRSPEGEKFREIWRAMLQDQFHFRPRTPDRLLEDNEIIDLGNLTIKILHCPGHSPGHLAFFFMEHEVLFMSDYDLTPFGPWYGDKYSDIEQIIASVKQLQKIPAKTWLTSHETGVFEQDPGELWDNYLGVIQTRENKLLELLKQPRTMKEIAGEWIIYGHPKEPIEEFEMMEIVHMKKHLNILMKKGIVAYSKEDGTYTIVSTQ